MWPRSEKGPLPSLSLAYPAIVIERLSRSRFFSFSFFFSFRFLFLSARSPRRISFWSFYVPQVSTLLYSTRGSQLNPSRLRVILRLGEPELSPRLWSIFACVHWPMLPRYWLLASLCSALYRTTRNYKETTRYSIRITYSYLLLLLSCPGKCFPPWCFRLERLLCGPLTEVMSCRVSTT